MHGVGAKSGLVPEEHFGALCLRFAGNGRIGFALPSLDGLRIALIGALQRLLRCQPQLRQQLTHRAHPEMNAKLLLDQFRHNVARPQAKVQAVLARVAPIDPAKHLPLLRRASGYAVALSL